MSKLIDIILPASQLEGTSATLTKWLVAVGESAKEGEPLIELETDKVAMEICAPANGVLSEVLAEEGTTVEVDSVLGRLTEGVFEKEDTTQSLPQSNQAAQDTTLSNSTNEDSDTDERCARHLVGPAVRRLLKEHNLNIDNINGTGRRGRVTRSDVQAYIVNPTQHARQNDQHSDVQSDEHSHSRPFNVNNVQPRAPQGTMVPHTPMRKAIANHMVESLLETSPHVTSVFEMDMTNIIEHRKWHKKEYAQHGAKLTFTAYFLAAIVEAAKLVPQVNARFHDDALEIFSDINIGVGTALGDKGLIVPVVQQVQSMSLFDIALALTSQTEKARSGKITQADMKHGTFTISNHGVSGSLFATPIIINQPEVAILGVGKLEKRVVVEEVNGADTMVIRPKCYVSLSIDHRALDAHQTNMFLAKFVEVIESYGE